MKVVSEFYDKDVVEQAPTGNKVRKFRDGWEFRDGDLYRRPTIDDLDLEKVLAKVPQIPRYVLERLKQQAPSNEKLSETIQRLRDILQASGAPAGGSGGEMMAKK